MILKNGKVNPLNALGLRKVLFPAKQFHYITYLQNSIFVEQQLDSWIYHNLNHRYYIGTKIVTDNNMLTYAIVVGFEQEKELSFFNLACPHLSS